MKRHAPRLATRLFAWFLGAIVLSAIVTGITIAVTRPATPEGAARILSRAVGEKLAREWDDPVACDAYVAELRESTGLDIRIRRDPEARMLLGPRWRRGNVEFRGGVALVPIVVDGAVRGVLEIRNVQHPFLAGWRWLFALAVLFALLFAFAASAARRLSRPLELVANATRKFGEGDLTVRSGIASRPRRWGPREVRDVATSFDRMAERIEDVVKDQRELLAAISHELRSPLGRARVAVEIAKDSDQKSEASLLTIEREIAEVDKILGDLLALGRAGLSDVRPEPTALVPFLKENTRAPRAVVVPESDDVAEVVVSLDRALFLRVIENIVGNAFAHEHPADKPVVIRVTRDDARVLLSFEDEGPGFPPELLPKAFDPFVRKGSARTPTPGGSTGLGLALVKRVVEAHGGSVRAENRASNNETNEPSGARVIVSLPSVEPNR